MGEATLKTRSLQISNTEWSKLSKLAWECRENAYLFGKTGVGAALITEEMNMYGGCNVEHQFRSHDVHAEINAITNMVAKGEKLLIGILIVAKRERFTPCGSCMDWIFQFGGKDCIVGFQGELNGDIQFYSADELMPHYPM